MSELGLLLRTGSLPWPVFQLANKPPPTQGCKQHAFILLTDVPFGQGLVGTAYLCSVQKIICEAWLTCLEVNAGCPCACWLPCSVVVGFSE